MSDTTLIVTSTPAPGHQDDLAEYVSKAGPMLMAAGGQLIHRCSVSESITKEPGYSTLLVMRFESADVLRELFASDAYQALIPIRDRAFSSIDISIGAELQPS